MDSGERKKEKTGKERDYATLRLLANRILTGSLAILFIGVCSFAILFIAMCLL